MSENETSQNEAEQEETPVETETEAEEKPAETESTEPEEKPAEEETTEDEEPKIAYTVAEIKSEPGSILRYCVDTDEAALDEKMAEILASLRKTIIVDGFRRGKAPLRLLKSRFGKDTQKDAINELAANITDQIIENDSLKVLAEATLHDSTVEEGKPVRLEIDIEVRPNIEISGYQGDEYEIELASVSDEIVDKQLEDIRQNSATYVEVEDADRAYAQGDGATLDIIVVDAHGKRMETLCQEAIFLRNPSRNLMPEVAEELVGKKPGETFEKVVGRTVKNRAGEDVTHEDTYTVTLKEVKERQAPDLDDEFAKDMGDFETLADFRKRIADDITERYEDRKRQLSCERILSKVLEANPFDAPKTLVAAQEYQTIMRDSETMERMGLDLRAMGMTEQQYLQTARANAEHFVKIDLALAAIAAQEKIEVGDEDVDKEIERRAKAEGRKPLAIRARLEAEKQLDGLKSQLLVQKVESFLVEKNTINIVEPKPAEAAEAAEATETEEDKTEE